MDTRDVVLADAFAVEPTGGVPVAVLPDGADLTDGQLRTVARELDAPVVAVPTDGSPDALRAIGPRGPADRRSVAVGGFAVAADRGWVDAGTYTPTVAGHVRDVTVDDDCRVWVDLDEPAPRPADADPGAVADALGVPAAALRDVGADFPPVRVSAGVDALAVPVNFLEHLGSARPDRVALADLAAEDGVAAVCAFTFDTLAADATCHARTFVAPGDAGDGDTPDHPTRSRTVGTEVPVAPTVAAATAIHLSRETVVEADDPVVEVGHYLDRPGRVHADPDGVRAGGRAPPSLDGTVAVPPPDDGDILEV